MKGRRRHITIGLFFAAVLLIGASILRATLEPAEHPACQRYADLFDGNNLLAFSHAEQARSDFKGDLKDDPDSECALKGLVLLSMRDCEAAGALLEQGLLSRAEKVFVAELDADPGTNCARTGLRQAADKRCRIARDLVARKLTSEAQEILKSETLADAPVICPGVLPQPAEAQSQQKAKTGG
jgi:hypothetical protein